MKNNRIIKFIFTVLIVLTVTEIAYYFWVTTQKKLTPAKKTAIEAQNKNILPENESKFLSDSYNQRFLPMSFDMEKNRLYLNIPPKDFLFAMSKMGINFGAWQRISTCKKEQLTSSVLMNKYQGMVSDLNLNKNVPEFGDFLYFKLKDENGIYSDFYYNKNIIKKEWFYKNTNNKVIALNWETELKDNDVLDIEEEIDMTKSPDDENYFKKVKIIKM